MSDLRRDDLNNPPTVPIDPIKPPQQTVEARTVIGVAALNPVKPGGSKVPTLIVLAGEHAGMMLRVPEATQLVIGRDPAVDLTIPDDMCSRRHVRIFREGAGQALVEDLKSTNGTFLNGDRLDRPMLLKEGDRIQLGHATVLKFTLQDEIEEKFQETLYRSATRDPLTGVFNKRFFLETLERECRHHARKGAPLSLVLFDLDFFKRVNDMWGHLAGDEVLKVVAKVVGESIRADDVLARYGGEEFTVVLPGTDLAAARISAERFRERVEKTPIPYGAGTLRATVSVGIAQLDPSMAAADLILVADQQLYRAKSEGRNRICC